MQLTEDGQINRLVSGREIVSAEKDGHWLIFVCSDGHRIRIGWRADDGSRLVGEPYVAGVDVSIALPTAQLFGQTGKL